MPQNLNNRLEQLEKDIYGLLQLQEQQCTDIHQLRPHSCKPDPPNEPCPCPCKVLNVQVQKVKSGIPITCQRQQHTASCKPCSKTKSDCQSRKSSPHRNQVEFENGCYKYCKCSATTEGSAKKKLNEEKEKVEQAHKIIEDLKEDLSYSKARMCTMAKDMALLTDSLQSVRNKYKNIKIFRKDAISQIEQLKNINSELCRKLEHEMKIHADQVQNIKLRESSKVDQLVKKEAEKLLEQSKQTYEKVQKANEKLKSDIEDLQSKYSEAQNEVENLRSELNSQARDISEKTQESEDIKKLLKEEKEKNSYISKTIDKLEYTVSNLMKVEKKAQKEINELKQQINDLEQAKGDHNKNMLCKDRECDKLKCECKRLKNQINEFAVEENAKCQKIEREMERLKQQMKDKESVINDEKNTLKSLVQELSDVVKKHKTRIKELVLINRQQEGLLKNQMIVLRNKDHQVKMSEIEVESAKNKNDHFQEQIEKLRTSLKTYEKLQVVEKEKECECKNKIKCIIKELNDTKSVLQEEQDKLLIKEKIIDDQNDTIQKLKNNINLQGNELKQHNSDIAKLQKELDNEKYDKEQLQQNIEDILWHKQQLKDQITDLEQALKEKSPGPGKMNQQNKLLVNLEHQVTMKQKEWELRCKLLSTEKKRAVQAAKFATQKLVDTVNDFQSHAQSQKQVQNMLTNMVQNKNKELKSAVQKISEFKDMMQQRDTQKPQVPCKCEADTPSHLVKRLTCFQDKKNKVKFSCLAAN